MNARYDDDKDVVTRHAAVHIGIATQTPAGLMVPVVRHAEARDPWSSAAEVARLSAAARAGKATRDELSGSTITITEPGAARRHRKLKPILVIIRRVARRPRIVEQITFVCVTCSLLSHTGMFHVRSHPFSHLRIHSIFNLFLIIGSFFSRSSCISYILYFVSLIAFVICRPLLVRGS